MIVNFKNKYFSILGDSISTLAGYNPPENEVFYDWANKRLAQIFAPEDTCIVAWMAITLRQMVCRPLPVVCCNSCSLCLIEKKAVRQSRHIRSLNKKSPCSVRTTRAFFLYPKQAGG